MDKSVPWVIVLASRGSNSDPRDKFVHPYLTLMIDSVSCTTLRERLRTDKIFTKKTVFLP